MARHKKRKRLYRWPPGEFVREVEIRGERLLHLRPGAECPTLLYHAHLIRACRYADPGALSN